MFNPGAAYSSAKRYPPQKKNSGFFDNNYGDHAVVSLSDKTIVMKIHQIYEKILAKNKPAPENGKGGLYTGCGGIAYMFYRLATCGNYDLESSKKFLDYAELYIDNALKHYRTRMSDDQKVPFITGCSGVWVVAALIYDKLDQPRKALDYIRRYKNLAGVCLQKRFSNHGCDELFVGRAGYIQGALLLNKELCQEVIPESTLNQLCRVIMESGRRCRSKMKFDGDLPVMFEYHGTKYLGAGHGVSGILQTLLSVRSFLAQNPRDLEDIYKTIDYMLDNFMHQGNMATDFDGAVMLGNGQTCDRQSLVHWCHGAAGVIFMVARAYTLCNNDLRRSRYLKVCKELAEVVWRRGLLHKGPGICHGIGGGGMVHLMMYRLTREQKYLQRAKKFADFLFTQQFRFESDTPDNPLSLFEGWAGTVCFMADILAPARASFPLFADVFEGKERVVF